MPYIIRATYLRYVLPFLFGVLAAAEDLPSLGDFVKARFVADISSEMTNYRVCELLSKSDDKRAFFRNAFGVAGEVDRAVHEVAAELAVAG